MEGGLDAAMTVEVARTVEQVEGPPRLEEADRGARGVDDELVGPASLLGIDGAAERPHPAPPVEIARGPLAAHDALHSRGVPAARMMELADGGRRDPSVDERRDEQARLRYADAPERDLGE